MPTPAKGPVPLSVSLRIEEALSGPIASWEMIFGDGKTRDGTGAPPHFAGHTFAEDGDYDVLLVVNQSNDRRYTAIAQITAGAGGGPGGPPPPPPPPPPGGTPPATATTTGTVLVGGRPFTGGTIPYNVVVDVTNGTLTLTTDTGKLKVFGEGKKITARFKLVRGTDKGKPIVELLLQGGNFSVCPKRKTSAVGATKARTVRSLWGDGKGRFRTKGRYSSATVRGTNWLTADRCDGTFTRVRRGVVEVRDIKKKRTIRVPAPQVVPRHRHELVSATSVEAPRPEPHGSALTRARRGHYGRPPSVAAREDPREVPRAPRPLQLARAPGRSHAARGRLGGLAPEPGLRLGRDLGRRREARHRRRRRPRV